MSGNDVTDRLRRGAALHQAKDYPQAIALYQSVVADDPTNFEAQTFLASAYRAAGRLDDALRLYDHVAEHGPNRADFWYNRGNALGEAGRRADALDAYERSLALDPTSATTFANKAICEVALGRPGSALDSYQRALAIDPTHRIALNNIGNLLADQGRIAEAANYLRRTIAAFPDLSEAHYNLSHALLRLGDFTTGFREYEYRWDTPDFFERPDYRGIPAWTGESLKGKRLIVHGEQGLGDTIQFAKNLGLLASLGGDIVYHIPEKLVGLMKTMPYPVRVTGTLGASDGDFQVPVMSLPYRLKQTFGSIPPDPSFLSADPGLQAEWQQKLTLDHAPPAIGFVWQGNPKSPAERGRSLDSAELLAPFAALQGVRLIALQMLPEEALEPAATPSGWRVRGLSFTLEHPGPQMDRGPDAFVDTAAILAGLDLFVSVCTAPLHVAGALGRPTLALLKTVPDWRWLMDRADTPWYPAMHLIRQQRGESYGPVIGRAVDAARKRLVAITSGKP